MTPIRAMMLLSMSTALVVSEANAADYFVQASKSGPVAGTPLATVSLRASRWGAAKKTEEDGTETTSSGSLRIRFEGRAGKWLRARREADGGESVEGGSTEEPTTGSLPQIESGSGSTEAESGATEGSESAGSAEGGAEGTTAETENPENTIGTTTTETTQTTETPTTTETAPTTETTQTTETPTTTETASTTPTNNSTSTTTTTTTSPTPSTVTPTAGQTYPSLDALLKTGSVKAGDRIFLMDGYHGAISLNGQRFSSSVVIAPVPGQTAHIESMVIRNSSNLVVSGLKVWPTSSNAGPGSLIRTYPDSSGITFTDMDVRSVADAANFPQWSGSQWTGNQRDGFFLDGDRMTATRNRITGIYMGIQSIGPNGLVEENIIDGFAGDGIRALGDNTIIRRNKAQNCFQINGNHADGFQSWSTGADGSVGTGTVRNLTIEGNKFFEWTLSTSNPARCKLQGIGMFDGMFDGVVIRNNIVTASGYHGISVAGAKNTTIANNTVIHPNGQAGNSPWIMTSHHKNGTPSSNVTIANNLVTYMNVSSDPSKNVLVTTNVVVSSASNEFTSVAKQDFRLKSTAKGIDAGDAKYSPKDDIAGSVRPKGKAPDAGAYESF